jgi:hypothetical protein
LIHVKTPASSTSIGAAAGVEADHQPLGNAGAGCGRPSRDRLAPIEGGRPSRGCAKFSRRA